MVGVLHKTNEREQTKVKVQVTPKKDKRHPFSNKDTRNKGLGRDNFLTVGRSDSFKNFSSAEALVTEIFNLRHLDCF